MKSVWVLVISSSFFFAVAPLGSGGFESISGFIKDLFADGGSGVLEFEEGGLPSMSSAQWSELDTALAA